MGNVSPHNDSRRICFAGGVILWAIVAGGLLGCGGDRSSDSTKSQSATLRIYAGAGLRPALEELIQAFTNETGISVEPDYGGSGIIISRAREDRHADIFMPGDVWYVDRLEERTGLISRRVSVCFFVPTIIVAKGNPKNIQSLVDFFNPDVRIALGNPQACQVGRISARIFEKPEFSRKTVWTSQPFLHNYP